MARKKELEVENPVSEQEMNDQFERIFNGEDPDVVVEDQPGDVVEEQPAPELPEGENPLQDVEVEDQTPVVDNSAERLREYEEKAARAEREAKEWKGRLEKEQKEKKELAAKLTESQTTAIKVDEGAIKSFFDDFPEIAKPVLMLIQQEIGKGIRFVIEKMHEETRPLADTVHNTAKKSHYELIRSAHPDVERIVSSGALDKWIASKPRYVQTHLNIIREAGSADDVVDMLKEFKAETGFGQKIKTPTPADTEGRQKRLDALKAVPSTPTQAPTSNRVDPNDFEAAWNDANRESK